jgi:hypothetical protein
MAFFPDLGTVTMVDEGSHVRAVGWLSPGEPFPQGEVPPEFVARLHHFARLWSPSTEALGWGVFLGFHTCEFCWQYNAGGNFGVPDGAVLFVAPQMIVHYVEAHRYVPPVEFVRAVLRAPVPDTAEYLAAVAAFRQRHQERQEERWEQVLERAACWAIERGGADRSIREAAIRWCGNEAADTLDRIRRKALVLRGSRIEDRGSR